MLVVQTFTIYVTIILAEKADFASVCVCACVCVYLVFTILPGKFTRGWFLHFTSGETGAGWCGERPSAGTPAPGQCGWTSLPDSPVPSLLHNTYTPSQGEGLWIKSAAGPRDGGIRTLKYLNRLE